ncbi:hypothetical protein GCM10010302_06030 [Streptomyces polychromogenes]|uniref:Uncharacterized protein n=1 Tax=Streptomyces polychromogenes TaxID=67342 RepID=A0ABN0V1Y6_9ACTN
MAAAARLDFRTGTVDPAAPAARWWVPFYVVGLSVLTEAPALLTTGLVSEWGEVVPRWVPLIGGRRVAPLVAVIPAFLWGRSCWPWPGPTVGGADVPDGLVGPDRPSPDGSVHASERGAGQHDSPRHSGRDRPAPGKGRSDDLAVSGVITASEPS